ncbi:MAG: polysaccharide deacetylase family protein [Alphaproteobacteria bacterium]
MTGLKRMLGALAALFMTSLGAAAETGAALDRSAVIVMYHRFGESAFPSTNIRLDQFETHLAEIAAGGYTVLPVTEIVAALGEGRALPDKTLGITVDDAFLSVYREAWPRLRAAGLPFTVFVATDPIDGGLADYMSWAQLREMAAAGVTIGHHGKSHESFIDMTGARMRGEIDAAAARFETELGRRPVLFAYPFGEYGRAVRDQVAARGFAAAFGQQSGALHAGLDRYLLPRFPLNESFGKVERFRLVTRALPLALTEITPADALLGPNPPALGFTLDPTLNAAPGLACYANIDSTPEMTRLGARRVEVRFSRPFGPGRARVNCTLPGPNGRWRWHGFQFYVPRP